MKCMKTGTKSHGVTSDAVISADGKYRYKLGRYWTPSVPPAVWIMLNPSTADAAGNGVRYRFLLPGLPGNGTRPRFPGCPPLRQGEGKGGGGRRFRGRYPGYSLGSPSSSTSAASYFFAAGWTLVPLSS
jgi:hypothetical protein